MQTDDPFGSKKPAVMNSPVNKGAPAKLNFHDELATNKQEQPSEYPTEQPMGGPTNLIECPTCSRKFNPKAYEKHSKICQKVFVEKRKAFDMKEQR